MDRSRIGILELMLAVSLAAIDLSVMRSWEPGRADHTIHYPYATGVLPMASVLIFVATLSIRNLPRCGRIPPFSTGSMAAGSLAVFMFVTAASLDTQGLREVGHGILILAVPFLRPLFERPPIETQIIVECLIVGFVFTMPQLLFSLLGSWLACWLGLSDRLDREERRTNTSIGGDLSIVEFRLGSNPVTNP